MIFFEKTVCAPFFNNVYIIAPINAGIFRVIPSFEYTSYTVSPVPSFVTKSQKTAEKTATMITENGKESKKMK